ncbi:acyltransferase [Neobacillus vireti]|uniref:acyltransferase n=1 Tax=Neobacillus vireti TaxID=220686 RepID=UPI002FFF3EAA
MESKSTLKNVKLGENVKVYDFVNAYDCEIGDGTRIGAFVEIQKGVKIGKNCKISSHSFLCEGVNIADEVFIGHGVMFTNDMFPRATTSDGTLQTESEWTLLETFVEKRASIGSGSTILPGITIGKGALVGAGSVVTKNVPENSVVAGNPAKVIRYIKE